MASNTGEGYRRGPIKGRVQHYENGRWIKTDTRTGKRMGERAEKWKGVPTKPKPYVTANYSPDRAGH
jgi:hypothetical protein